jgi:endonuclease/exonuclease/phosphatase family metal-dependent hydrolase
MRRVLTSAIVALGLFALAAAGRSVPAAESPGGLTVMTFNIQHGIDGSHKYNLQRAIDTIPKTRPDLVGLQEVTRNHPYTTATINL